MSFEFYQWFPPEFPMEEVIQIGERLERSGLLVPGFIPPPVGLLNIRAIIYGQKIDRYDFLILPDRNLVSRMAQVAEHGTTRDTSAPAKLAIDLMAYCQVMDINFEPSIAFHELASVQGNEEARRELGWFRAADRSDPQSWIDLAMGRRETLALGKPKIPPLKDLAFPLRRWRRNYIVALKIAELELTTDPAIEKALKLFEWMWNDFQIAGSAAVFATTYFAPGGKRRRLIKQLRSEDRSLAIKGVKNAAWDITHMSDFVERVGRTDEERIRVVFATGDITLARIAPMTMASPYSSDEQRYLRDMLDGWSDRDADTLTRAIIRFFDRPDETDRPPPPSGPNIIDDMIAEGERRLLNWHGS